MRNAALILLLALLGSCGLKDDLYLPTPEKPPLAVEPAPTTPSEEEDDQPAGAGRAPQPQ
jgi:predicted small lipoprotein YifL